MGHTHSNNLLRRESSLPSDEETFFIDYCQRNQVHQNAKAITDVDIEQLDARRVVFVSVIGLFRSWKATPTYILHSCIVIMPFDRAWLKQYRHRKYAHRPLPGSDADARDFVRFIRYKDHQRLVFWAEDEYETQPLDDEKTDELVAPFWRHVSQQLTELHDPIQRRNYAPFKFNVQAASAPSRYGVSRSAILTEMYFVTLKYATMQEIIYQSNPDSLNPMVSYCAHNVDRTCSSPLRVVERADTLDTALELQCAGFWISPDYDTNETVDTEGPIATDAE